MKIKGWVVICCNHNNDIVKVAKAKTEDEAKIQAIALVQGPGVWYCQWYPEVEEENASRDLG